MGIDGYMRQQRLYSHLKHFIVGEKSWAIVAVIEVLGRRVGKNKPILKHH